MGVAPVAGVKREGEAGILEPAGMLKTGTFSPLFPFSPSSRAPRALTRPILAFSFPFKSCHAGYS